MRRPRPVPVGQPPLLVAAPGRRSLTVYDLEGLGRAPAHLVLSACDVGLSSVRPGDELMGLTSVLVAMGAQSLVASVVPVPTTSPGRSWSTSTVA